MEMSWEPLFTSVLDSSLNELPLHVRWVFISIWLKADRHGYYRGTAGAIARSANVTVEEAEDAIQTLTSPDPLSLDDEEEGRRLVPYDRGWMVVKKEHYRQLVNAEFKREAHAERNRRYRDRKRDAGVTPRDAERRGVIHRDAAATDRDAPLCTETETETETEKDDVGLKPDAPSPSVPSKKPRSRKRKVSAAELAEADEIIAFLNAKTGRSYRARHPDGTATGGAVQIAKLLRKGYTADNLRGVIVIQHRKWADDVSMSEYLRPDTLFRPSNFAKYRGSLKANG